jgi:membrane protein implicated in regulation of membrane protease activity
MDDPVVWGGIWLAVAASMGVSEMVSAGSFWLAPFAVAALPASIVSFIGAPVAVGWLVFLFGSVVAFLAMRPLAKRLDLDVPPTPGIGANRLVGHEAVIVEEIPFGTETQGMVRAGGETWNAITADEMAIPAGAAVRIVEVRGTRVVVEPAPDSDLHRFT